MPEVVIGVDIGTQGVRVMAVDGTGHIHASHSQGIPMAEKKLPDGWFEHDPLDWWQATVTCLKKTIFTLKQSGVKDKEVIALSVDSTSGTILPIDSAGTSLYPALMYNDSRSQSVLAAVRLAGKSIEDKLGYSFNSTFALPKIIWVKESLPEIYKNTHRFIHAADFIVGRITNDYSCTDHSNALKTGFDLLDYSWPEFIEKHFDLPLQKLPRVVKPGDLLGYVSKETNMTTGLPMTTKVVAGCTDGTASQIASGSVKPGTWNSTLGTTLVIKGISKELIKDPLGRFYCHLHPEGLWMPGGASNTGTEWILKEYPEANLIELNQQAERYLPTGLVSYPLSRRGERLPFVVPDAEGFMLGTPENAYENFAAKMEGLAFLERLTYESLEGLGADVGDTIYATGGGAKSDIWLKIRASVLSRRMVKPRVSETAMGAAILAASKTIFDDINQASENMVSIDKIFNPEPLWVEDYGECYNQFCDACRKRGYIN